MALFKNMLSGVPIIYGINPRLESSTPEHQLGSIGVAPDGRKFRYAKAGASALVAGQLLQSPAENTNHQSVAVAATEVGSFTVKTTDNLTVTANQYADGYLVATGEGGTGNGYAYRIKSHPAASGTTLTIELYEPLKVAFSSSTQVDLVANPYNGVIASPATPTGTVVGVAVLPITAGNFGWIQTGGLGVVKADASAACTVGAALSASNATAGCVENATGAQAIVGYAATGIASNEFGAAHLIID